MHRSSLRALGAALVLSSLLLASCGTSGGDDDADTTTTTAEQTDDATTTTEATDDETTTTEASDDGEAQARAEAVDLTEEDLGDGWTAQEPSDGEDSTLNECSDTFTDDSNELASFRDDDFVFGDVDGGDGAQFAVETKVFTDEDEASAEIAPFADADVLACIDAGFKEQFTGSVDAEVQIDGEFAETPYEVTTADEAIFATAEYTITANGETTTLAVGVLLLRTGDLASQVRVLGIGENLDAIDLQGPVSRVEELQASA